MTAMTPAERAGWHKATTLATLTRIGFGPEAAAELYRLAVEHSAQYGGFAAALDAFRGVK